MSHVFFQEHWRHSRTSGSTTFAARFSPLTSSVRSPSKSSRLPHIPATPNAGACTTTSVLTASSKPLRYCISPFLITWSLCYLLIGWFLFFFLSDSAQVQQKWGGVEGICCAGSIHPPHHLRRPPHALDRMRTLLLLVWSPLVSLNQTLCVVILTPNLALLIMSLLVCAWCL